MISPEPFHAYTFEVWPDPMPPGNYPVLLPGRVSIEATTPELARKKARQQIQPGQSTGAGSHWRSRCNPPHPGTD